MVGVPTSSSVDPTIGASRDHYYGFNGSIDDVRVYNRALSEAEVRALHAYERYESFTLLRQTPYTVAESANVVSVGVLLGPEQLYEQVTVDYATIDGTAHAGEDYVAVSGTLQFAAGETNKLITIPLLNDALKESEEQFGLVLSNPTGGVSLGNSNAVIRIQDNDPGIGLATTEVFVGEAGGYASLMVVRGDDLNLPFTVDYEVTGGTATPGMDFLGTSGTVQFAAGETNKAVVIPILNDGLHEPEEAILLTLNNPNGGVSLGNPITATVRIVDNDPGVRFMNENVAVSEGAGVVSVGVQRGDDLNLPFTVDYATVNETAHAGEDYVAASGTLHFAADETNKLITIPILNDALKESEEQFRIVLSNPTDGVSLGNSNAVVRIQDNDPGVRFMTENVAVSEGAGVVVVEVLRGDDLNLPFTVDYATVNETAHAGEDYVAASGTLQFAAGETNKQITITILDDALKEPVELFRLVLSNPTGGVSLTDSNVVIRIRSDELLPYYVNLNNPNPVFPYNSWATAATNIQHAVDAANSGDTVLVTNGVYAVGGQSQTNEWGELFRNRVFITNAIRLESVNGPLVTIIVGSTVLTNELGEEVEWEEGRCVYLGTNAVLSGFTLTKGRVSNYDVVAGGGVFSEPSGVVTNCVITDSYASASGLVDSWGQGGGAYGGSLYNCTLTGNSAGRHGGGVYGSTLYNCTLTGNSARGNPDHHGGGASDSTLYNCTLTGNSAGGGAGASDSTLYNCTLTGNSSSWGGLGAARESTLYNCTVTGNDDTGVVDSTLYNCTLTDNSHYGASRGTLYNSIVYGNTNGNYTEGTILNYCLTTPLPANGVGNLDADPRFVNAAAGDFRLRVESPCIDAGTNLVGFTMMATNVDTGEIYVAASYTHGPTDILGNTRFMDGNYDGTVAWDMGAYEFNPYRFEPTLSLTADGFRFTIRGEPGRSVRVERSRDLVTWEFAGQVPIPASGQTLIDPAATTEPRLFYRAMRVP